MIKLSLGIDPNHVHEFVVLPSGLIYYTLHGAQNQVVELYGTPEQWKELFKQGLASVALALVVSENAAE